MMTRAGSRAIMRAQTGLGRYKARPRHLYTSEAADEAPNEDASSPILSLFPVVATWKWITVQFPCEDLGIRWLNAGNTWAPGCLQRAQLCQDPTMLQESRPLARRASSCRPNCAPPPQQSENSPSATRDGTWIQCCTSTREKQKHTHYWTGSVSRHIETTITTVSPARASRNTSMP